MGLFDDVGNFVSQGVKGIGNFYGIDNSGRWTNQGGIFKWADEGVGEITGRNQSRAALNQAGDQFNIMQTQAQDLIKQQRFQSMQADIQASQQASAATKTAAATSGLTATNATPLSYGSKLGTGQKDFLGL